jgi:GNAT superfamily N-acetyltransferase
LEIRIVKDKNDLRRFIELPYQLYKNDPIWVPPLRKEQFQRFDSRYNPMLNHCDYSLFLLFDNGQAIGRISAFVDHLTVKFWKECIGLFGSYECVDSDEGSRLLLETARTWLHEHSMKVMRGPWSFASQEWGLVIEGFTPSPVVLAPYNPSYYNRQLTAFGMEKAKDLLVYYADSQEGFQIPERYLAFAKKVQKEYGIKLRPLDMSRLKEEITTIVGIINRSIGTNWGFRPVTEEEAEAMARDMKPILDPRAVVIAEEPNGEPIGFSISIPDINILLRGLHGRLFPLGWVKLMYGISRLKKYRIWGLGIIPEYQMKGVGPLLYCHTYEMLYSRGVSLEINWVLEDNDRMNNALHKLGVKLLRRYRVYEMLI